MPTVLEAGVVLAGRHRLDRPLGEGGMGVVWAATNMRTGMPVAVKLLKPGGSSAERSLDTFSPRSSAPERPPDARGKERFLREARAAAAVRHPNVVQIYDLGGHDHGNTHIGMDHQAGESQRTPHKRSGALGVREAAQILVPVLSAVGAAHSLGIVHRDLKPDNIFLCDDDNHGKRVKVLDFGIAKQTAMGSETQDAALTATGMVVGTPYYMSPEQVFGDSDIDHRADVWALGVLMYECFTGVRPTQADGVGQVLKVIMKGSIPPLSSAAPTVPAELAGTIDRMLSRDRADRPA
ncbi:MAG: serine/threonine-protein kinase, partial [Polyangiaceae bacterium]